MVAGRIVEGLPCEIAEKISQLVGNRRVSVMLMETAEMADTKQPLTEAEFLQVMEEIKADAVSVPHVDDSREGIYTRQDDE